jgi:hypothetical protein
MAVDSCYKSKQMPKTVLFFTIIFILTTTACAAKSAPPTPTIQLIIAQERGSPTPTATATATAIPSATPTATPTATATPTSTFTPGPLLYQPVLLDSVVNVSLSEDFIGHGSKALKSQLDTFLPLKFFCRIILLMHQSKTIAWRKNFCKVSSKSVKLT